MITCPDVYPKNMSCPNMVLYFSPTSSIFKLNDTATTPMDPKIIKMSRIAHCK